MEYVRLEKLGYQISGRNILQDVNVVFAQNKITAIIGKSGSGKSTLIKMINGLLVPGDGSVIINGKPMIQANSQKFRKDIGYTVQGIGLFPHLTVRENILLTGKIFSEGSGLQARLAEVLRLVNLPHDLIDKYPYQLSGGEQQRAAISRALFLDPPLLLMDEPFASLDPITRFKIIDEFVQLQNTAPRTVLFVTHDLREAKKLADEVLVIDQGRVEQFGRVYQIFENPASNVVRELLNAAGL